MGLVALEQDPGTGSGSLRRGGLTVAVASNVANGLGLAFNIALIRLLDQDGYGAVGALLALILVGSVPGLALQVVLARRTATARPADWPALWPGLLARSAVIGVAVAVLGAVLSPVATRALHLGTVAAMLWLAVALVPTTVLFAAQGLLQGAERFTALSVCLLAAATGRLAGLAGTPAGPAGVMAGIAVGTAAAMVVGLALVGRDVRGRPAGTWRGSGADRLVPELRSATSGMSSLFTLQNLDIVLARHFLPSAQSGVYAAGALVARGTFWVLHVVAVVVLPRLADAARRRMLLPRALGLVAAGGAVLTGCALLAGPTLLPVAFGDDYRTLGATVAVFALVGGLIALAELLLYADLAGRRHRMAWGMWASAALVTGIVYAVPDRSVRTIIWLDALALAALTGAACVFLLSRRRRPPTPAECGSW